MNFRYPGDETTAKDAKSAEQDALEVRQSLGLVG
jgi:hypothetical protein